MIRTLTVVVVAVIAVGSVHVLREATMTRHTEMPPESYLVVSGTAEVRSASHDTETLLLALVSECVVEANPGARMRGFAEDDGAFSFEVTPALDDPDRRQLQGCLEDFRVSGLLANVDEMDLRGVD